MQPVQSLLVTPGKEVRGVVLQDGQEIRSKIVLSNATAKVTFLDLLEKVRLFSTLLQTGGVSLHLPKFEGVLFFGVSLILLWQCAKKSYA